MINVEFKNVGQGDSIFISWMNNGKEQIGIIDSNIYNDVNPILDELTKRKIEEIEFIILTHFHHDHFSGFSEIFEYCLINNVTIKRFLHTFKSDYFRILDSQLKSIKINKDIEKFWESFDKVQNKLMLEIEEISFTYSPINLFSNVFLKFLAPSGKDSLKLIKQQAQFKNDIRKLAPNFNLVSTIIEIYNSENSILLTSDAVRECLELVKNKVSNKVLLAQAPHHGSSKNHTELFWNSIGKVENCTIVFSVGDIKRDKLPNKNVVAYFDINKYHIESTNYVYGLPEYFGGIINTHYTKRLLLGMTGKVRKTSIANITTNPRFYGDKIYSIKL